MKVPLDVRFNGVRKTSQAESLISSKAVKLEEFCSYITRCRVVVERPHRYEASGSRYRVRIDVTVPHGHELVVHKRPLTAPSGESLEAVILEAFKTMERRLRELVARQKGETKHHDGPNGSALRRLRPQESWQGTPMDGATR